MTVVRGRLAWQFEPIRLVVPPRRGAIHESDVELELVRRLGIVSGRELVPQLTCHEIRPDITMLMGRTLTIVELKRWFIDRGALGQLAYYVEHWRSHLDEEPEDWTLYGILAAPVIDPNLELPYWCAFQPLDVVDAREVAA